MFGKRKGCKVANSILFNNNEKKRRMGRLGEKQMDLMFFTYILGHNGNDGIWQGFMLM